ncbi:CIC11C00000005710 [Sungouiella intermedia]|uniref:CIC11C00000005710 n=1 Tax=Sungouiella intermedia TaxID=45354 RepID=A0A1L0DR12_9ASCO|nr:CIC11C00000005710 [[Candida] intermedia]
MFYAFILPLVVYAIITCNAHLETDVTGLSKRDVGSMTFLSRWKADFQIGSEKDDISFYFDFDDSWNYLPVNFVGCNTSVSGTNEFSNSTTNATKNTCVFSTNFGDLTNLKSRYNSTLQTTILTDKLIIGDYQVDGVDFVPLEYNDTIGFLGLGLPYQSIDDYYNISDGSHKNFVQQLHQTGVIDSSILSLWLNPGNKSEGQFAFGGIDEAKYNGSLFRFPMVNSFAYLEHSKFLEIKMDSLLTSTMSFTQPVGMSLNPSALSTWFPQSYFEALVNALGGKYDEKHGGTSVHKKYLTLNEVVTFKFGNFNLSVPISSLVEERLGKVYTTFVAGNIATLGLDILQHAYIAIDYDNNEVALGQSKANALDSEKFVNATSNLSSILLASGASETSLAIEMQLALQSPALILFASQRSYGSLSGNAAYTGPLMGLFGLIAGVLMAV